MMEYSLAQLSSHLMGSISRTRMLNTPVHLIPGCSTPQVVPILNFVLPPHQKEFMHLKISRTSHTMVFILMAISTSRRKFHQIILPQR